MHPALSVILFTTLSGAGYGLLFWTAFRAAFAAAPARSLLASVALALVLTTLGLLASLWHLGKPTRAWRAFSQWRTSWLSREGVAAMATFAVAVLLGAALLPGMLDADAAGARARLGAAGTVVALLAMAAAMATVYCTAMIYASLKPIPAWRHPLVLPAYLGFALLGGGLLLAAIAPAAAPAPASAMAFAAIAAAIALAVLKLAYWRGIDAAALPATRGDAVGLPGRGIDVFERPHTEASYITREMAFVLARRHSRRLRALSVALFAVLPGACLLPVALQAGIAGPAWFLAAALSVLAGSFVERWLFFAEARHVVTLYY